MIHVIRLSLLVCFLLVHAGCQSAPAVRETRTPAPGQFCACLACDCCGGCGHCGVKAELLPLPRGLADDDDAACCCAGLEPELIALPPKEEFVGVLANITYLARLDFEDGTKLILVGNVPDKPEAGHRFRVWRRNFAAYTVEDLGKPK